MAVAPRESPPRSWHVQAGAFVISAAIHLSLLFVFFTLTMTTPFTATPAEPPVETKAADAESKPRFDTEDIGRDPTKSLNYNVDRVETVSVPGPLRLDEAVGIVGAPSGAARNVSPPPGLGAGAGGATEATGPAVGSTFGDVGGFLGGRLVPGQMFAGRSGATREKMAAEGGGTTASDAAVIMGLRWLKSRQKVDGHWAMIEGSHQDEFGATGLALLPFLGYGITHKPNPKDPVTLEYAHNVNLGLNFLVRKQAANGVWGNDGSHRIYDHAVCTVAVCEAYGMTHDPALKKAAQKALDYLVKYQHERGGFRYSPGDPGDVSVTGWCLQALQSGKLAGLSVPAETFVKINSFLDDSSTEKGAAYGYLGPGNKPSMNAVGLLCRAYLGWGPRNPNMMAGIDNLRPLKPPSGGTDMYFYYYATQVMHFCAAEDVWQKEWNPKMRDYLVNSQDSSEGPNRGSWTPDDSMSGRAGGRLCWTSFSLLTLEVYYRHLPLYKRDSMGGGLN